MIEVKYDPENTPTLKRGKRYDDPESNLGSYQTSATQFPNPEDMKVFTGNGIEAQDLERGFCRPLLTENPAYDMDNYKDRWTQPYYSDLTEGGPGLPEDFAFRKKNRASKGFLTRPRIPAER